MAKTLNSRIPANMGAKTCLITMDMNKIGQMSCNFGFGSFGSLSHRLRFHPDSTEPSCSR
jgi:tRNA U34 5-carboxymethylaminomethyl modifying enzyme MnmG/GidA